MHWEKIEGSGTKRKHPDEPNTVVNPPGADATQNEQMLRVLFTTMRSSPTFWKDFIEETTLERIRTWTTTSRLFNEYFSQRSEFWYYLLKIKLPRAFERKESKFGSRGDQRWIAFGKDILLQHERGPNLYILLPGSYEWITVNRTNGETIYEAFDNKFNKDFKSASEFSEWLLLNGNVEMDGNRGQWDSNIEGSFPLNEEDFRGAREANEIYLRITEEYAPPTIKVNFVLPAGEVAETEIEPERMLNSFYPSDDFSIQQYAQELDLPVGLPAPVEYDRYNVRITEQWTGDNNEITFTLGERNIWEAFLEFMKGLRHLFSQHAGPWVGDDITWQNRIEIIRK